MDLVLFKARFSEFTDDVAIESALIEAALLIDLYNIREDKLDIALGYLAAHLLVAPKGATEQKVIRVKSDTDEVQFSDKSGQTDDFLSSSSYGILFSKMIKLGDDYLEFMGFVV